LCLIWVSTQRAEHVYGSYDSLLTKDINKQFSFPATFKSCFHNGKNFNHIEFWQNYIYFFNSFIMHVRMKGIISPSHTFSPHYWNFKHWPFKFRISILTKADKGAKFWIVIMTLYLIMNKVIIYKLLFDLVTIEFS